MACYHRGHEPARALFPLEICSVLIDNPTMEILLPILVSLGVGAVVVLTTSAVAKKLSRWLHARHKEPIRFWERKGE
jgi:hypothetical protein